MFCQMLSRLSIKPWHDRKYARGHARQHIERRFFHRKLAGRNICHARLTHEPALFKKIQKRSELAVKIRRKLEDLLAHHRDFASVNKRGQHQKAFFLVGKAAEDARITEIDCLAAMTASDDALIEALNRRLEIKQLGEKPMIGRLRRALW